MHKKEKATDFKIYENSTIHEVNKGKYWKLWIDDKFNWAKYVNAFQHKLFPLVGVLRRYDAL